MGVRPGSIDQEYLQEMGYHTNNEHALAFEVLISKLSKEIIDQHGEVIITYLGLDDNQAQKIIQTLKWIIASNKADPGQNEMLDAILIQLSSQ